MSIELPATVREYAKASGWSEASIRRFVQRKLLRIDPLSSVMLIVDDRDIPRRPMSERCPYTIDMFEEVEVASCP